MTKLFKAAAALAVVLFVPGSRGVAQAPQEPKWPQPFHVLQGGDATFGFAVSQAGPISVNVTARGAPVVVELSGPIAQPMRKSGTGTINITIAATAADVQKSAMWLVRISAANPSQPAKNRAPQELASGTIDVKHPPGKLTVAAHKAPPNRGASAPRNAAAMAAPNATLTSQYQAQLATKQKAEQERMQRMVSATQVATAQTHTPIKRAPSGPVITSLSITKGLPGDFMVILGRNLGEWNGEVHFILNPGMDVKAVIGTWRDTLIMTSVPTVTGIRDYAGQVYLKMKGPTPMNTASLPFQFEPDTEFVDLTPWETHPDAHIDPTDLAPVCGDRGVCRDGSFDFQGHQTEDVWFATTQLKNGWVVHDVNAHESDVYGFTARAYVVDSRVGTSYPYAKVHWQMDAFTSFNYAVNVIIKGPKGTTYY